MSDELQVVIIFKAKEPENVYFRTYPLSYIRSLSDGMALKYLPILHRMANYEHGVSEKYTDQDVENQFLAQTWYRQNKSFFKKSTTSQTFPLGPNQIAIYVFIINR